ncbi:MAG: ATP-dependent 6-phosphofructokinase [Gemmatimonadetes bacterium]|nr:ATP-dependent 6-phosphofructokinase [Gemmatimonadota bacterium]
MRVAICTGGGDAPGLNAVIRSVVLTGTNRGWEMHGVEQGFGGLLGEADVVSLGRREVYGITHVGGTILGTTNRGNPFKWPRREADGSWSEVDRSNEVLAAFREHRLDALIVVGGDGTLHIAFELWKKGLPVVGIPKTIDNDVGGTLVTFGFDTAVSTATDAIDKVRSTAASHRRVLVVELMGRNAGWIALNSGLAGDADVVLIPEIPFEMEKVCAKILEREERGLHHSIVVVAEGAAPKSGEVSLNAAAGPGFSARLGGMGNKVAQWISEMTGKETRAVALGHLQRGGTPTTFDRLLALRFGAEATRAVAAGRFGDMVAYKPPKVETLSLEVVLGQAKLVPLDGDTICTARELGVSLGD